MSVSGRLAKGIADYGDSRSLGSRFRARRIGPLLSLIDTVFAVKGSVRIIDLGGTRQYWNIVPTDLLEQRDVRITLVNLPESVTPVDEDHFEVLAADACDLASIPDDDFDITHSNSVLEHVGDWERMRAFAREAARVSPRYFVQTPSYWFPIEPHAMTPFFHWLPKPARVRLVRRFGLGHWKRARSVDEAVRIVESARLVNRPMMRSLFPDATIVTERMLMLPKSFVAVKGLG